MPFFWLKNSCKDKTSTAISSRPSSDVAIVPLFIETHSGYRYNWIATSRRRKYNGELILEPTKNKEYL
jgi:hypothetical protein